jgi:hypothetical protein
MVNRLKGGRYFGANFRFDREAVQYLTHHALDLWVAAEQ